jgi:hypothetical protein
MRRFVFTERRAPTIAAMLLAAKVWHYWISIVLVATGVLAMVAVGVGYLVKVASQKYPRQQ